MTKTDAKRKQYLDSDGHFVKKKKKELPLWACIQHENHRYAFNKRGELPRCTQQTKQGKRKIQNADKIIRYIKPPLSFGEKGKKLLHVSYNVHVLQLRQE